MKNGVCADKYHLRAGVWWRCCQTVPGKATLADCTFNPVISGALKTWQNKNYKYLSYHFTPTFDDGKFYLRVWRKVK